MSLGFAMENFPTAQEFVVTPRAAQLAICGPTSVQTFTRRRSARRDFGQTHGVHQSLAIRQFSEATVATCLISIKTEAITCSETLRSRVTLREGAQSALKNGRRERVLRHSSALCAQCSPCALRYMAKLRGSSLKPSRAQCAFGAVKGCRQQRDDAVRDQQLNVISDTQCVFTTSRCRNRYAERVDEGHGAGLWADMSRLRRQPAELSGVRDTPRSSKRRKHVCKLSRARACGLAELLLGMCLYYL
ncbi:hypothetical protein EVAR_82909_1 [Eumeta japonica]|uniref:Uncharacterized protein n=1 Tax=Eumeta variegata TaxID=151549 RepID=A0A4C1X0A6_EUMVA|nr:hypothetical protein EVAR_82909_1 [Eumeta japonica]